MLVVSVALVLLMVALAAALAAAWNALLPWFLTLGVLAAATIREVLTPMPLPLPENPPWLVAYRTRELLMLLDLPLPLPVKLTASEGRDT